MSTNFLRSYGDTTIVDSVVPEIEILTARESMIFNMLGKTRAKSTVHEFQTDTLPAAGLVSSEEADDYSYNALTTPTRRVNLVQHINYPFAVSDTQRAVEHFSGDDELVRQTQKALMHYANLAEFNLVRATLVSGASGTGPRMSGIIEAISTASTTVAYTSGTIWNATILDGLVQGNYNVSNGDMATDLFMGSWLRAKTDSFTQKSNVVVAGELTTIDRTVSTYKTAFSTLRVNTHRYVQQSSDATGRVLAIRPDKLKVAFLEAPYIDTNIARTGRAEKRAVVGSMTLECRNQNSNFFATGFHLTQ